MCFLRCTVDTDGVHDWRWGQQGTSGIILPCVTCMIECSKTKAYYVRNPRSSIFYVPSCAHLRVAVVLWWKLLQFLYRFLNSNSIRNYLVRCGVGDAVMKILCCGGINFRCIHYSEIFEFDVYSLFWDFWNLTVSQYKYMCTLNICIFIFQLTLGRIAQGKVISRI